MSTQNPDAQLNAEQSELVAVAVCDVVKDQKEVADLRERLRLAEAECEASREFLAINDIGEMQLSISKKAEVLEANEKAYVAARAARDAKSPPQPASTTNPPVKTIVVNRRGDHYVAFVGDCSGMWGRGASEQAAIGDLVMAWPAELGLVVAKQPTTPTPTATAATQTPLQAWQCVQNALYRAGVKGEPCKSLHTLLAYAQGRVGHTAADKDLKNAIIGVLEDSGESMLDDNGVDPQVATELADEILALLHPRTGQNRLDSLNELSQLDQELCLQ